MIIHISRQRYEFILSLGYGLTITEEVSPTPLNVVNGDHIYHLLGGEEDVCGSCGGIFKSVDANSAVELETIKGCIEMGRDPAKYLKLMRQDMIAHYKELLEGNTHESHP